MLHPLNPRRNDRRLVRGRRFVVRRLTASLRAWPGFLIVGAMKSGTSSLFNYLSQHPLVVPPLRKEVHYFTLGHRNGKTASWYRAHFPLRAQLPKGGITGEGTPGYMFEPGAPERIAALLPQARLIVILRDPVERAISQYFHEVRMGREYLPIDEAMALEDERVAAAQAAGEAGLETSLHACYKARGVYVDQIETLQRLFPPDQILILGSGSLFRTPEAAMRQVLGFLGLGGAGTRFRFEARNSGGERPAVPDHVYDDLRQFFAPHNARLFRRLGRELDW